MKCLLALPCCVSLIGAPRVSQPPPHDGGHQGHYQAVFCHNREEPAGGEGGARRGDVNRGSYVVMVRSSCVVMVRSAAARGRGSAGDGGLAHCSALVRHGRHY